MLFLLVTTAVLVASAQARPETPRVQTPLDEYVWRPDDTYRWEVLKTYWEDGVTTYYLLMYSQTWYSEEYHNHPEWWHHLMISVPDEVLHFDEAAIFIEGGRNSNMDPPNDDEFIILSRDMARTTNSVAAILKQIPNQPITFVDDPSGRGRTEDSLIAWTWEEFRLNKTGGAYLAQCPMTKGSVKAMDAMTEFTSTLDERFNIQKYIVAGGSKRGWTAWLAAAVDTERTVALAPIVMTALNFVDNVNHHYQAYGGYSWTMQDYYDLGLGYHLNDPHTQRIFDVVDPITYKDRYTMPTYVMCAPGDEFFLPDDTYYFWDELKEVPGPKYLNVIPNAEHSLITRITHVYQTLRSFWYAVATGYPLPTMTWDKEWTETGGRLTAYMDTVPSRVTRYTATTLSSTMRDFRLVKPLNGTGPPFPNPVLWFSSNATMLEETVYTAEVENPEEGWRGMLIEVRFPGPKEGEDWELVFTTEVLITPDYLPFPPCQTPEECQGTLL